MGDCISLSKKNHSTNFQKEKTALITYGYVRKSTEFSLCNPITDIIVNYTYHAIIWNIDEKCIAKIFKLNYGHIFEGPKYKFRLHNNHIFLQFHILKTTNGISLFLVPIDDNNRYIAQTTLCTELRCTELHGCIKTCVEGKMEWRLCNEDTLQKHKSITLNCEADVLRLVNNYQQISLNRRIKSVWLIKNGLMQQFKDAPVGWCFYLDNIDPVNKNWCLRCIPYNKGNCIIQLKCLRFPKNIHSIKAQIKLSATGKITWGWNVTEIDHKFDRNYKWFVWNTQKELMLSSQKLYDLNQLKIKVCIKVVAVYKYDSSMNAVAVPCCDWKKYNVNL